MRIIPDSYGAGEEALLVEYNRCHEPAGTPAGGRFATKGTCGTSSDLAVHLDRTQARVEPVLDTWNKKAPPLFYEAHLPDGRKVQLKGRPLSDWERENTVLYHVTTNLEGVLGDGEITAFESGGGLGGGQHPAVSFTANRHDALNILSVLTAATRIAHYEDPMPVLRAWANAELAALAKTKYPPKAGDGPLDAVPMFIIDKVRDGLAAAQRQYEAASGDWQRSIGRADSPYNIKTQDDARAEAGLDALRSWLHYRESATLGKNPVLFTRGKDLRRAKTLGIIAVPGRSIPKNVLVNVGADGFQSEVEVHGDVPITQAYYLSRKRAS